jgi:cyclic pyranopterin phosphate synthase
MKCTDSFRRFNDLGGKFRLAIINRCNLDCFFCHNEGMVNPRRGGDRRPVDALMVDDLVGIANAYARLGGKQINLTGGEPLAHPQLVDIVGAIDKRGTRIALNTNALLAGRLLERPRVEAIDQILTSLHATDERTFVVQLGGRRGSASRVMHNIAALARHGYSVTINYSLGAHNRDRFDGVLDYVVDNGLNLKAIALVRSNTDDGFYGGDWVEPSWLDARLEARGARCLGARQAFGGIKTAYTIEGVRVEVKNVAAGRLHTDFCTGCQHRSQCGEGIYGLRIGVDGIMKPCLLRRERFSTIDRNADYEGQILDAVHAMVGHWPNAYFATGAPA